MPKLIAVPLVLGLFTNGGYILGTLAERRYRAYCLRKSPGLSKVEVQHRVLSVAAFVAFNYFFVFGGRPFILLLPSGLQYFWLSMVVMLSSLWLYRTWNRSPQRYLREGLASRLRKQLAEVSLRLTSFLEGRSLSDLSADEVYVLAKVLPGFTHDKRLSAYQAILREGIEAGSINSQNSLELLQHMRQELAITDDEHNSCLARVGIQNPELLEALLHK